MNAAVLVSSLKCYVQILLVPTLGRNRAWQWKIAMWNKIWNKTIIYSLLIKHGNETSPIDRDLITFRRSSWNMFLDWRYFNLPTCCMDQRDLIFFIFFGDASGSGNAFDRVGMHRQPTAMWQLCPASLCRWAIQALCWFCRAARMHVAGPPLDILLGDLALHQQGYVYVIIYIHIYL